MTDAERLVVTVVRIHRGAKDTALIDRMVAVMVRFPGEITEEFDGSQALLAEDALRVVGKPALPAVEKAAADKETGHRFERLLEELKAQDK